MKKEKVMRMTSLEEIKKYLREEYGIMSYKDLENRINEIGGIKIGIFVDRPVDIKT